MLRKFSIDVVTWRVQVYSLLLR